MSNSWLVKEIIVIFRSKFLLMIYSCDGYIKAELHVHLVYNQLSFWPILSNPLLF